MAWHTPFAYMFNWTFKYRKMVQWLTVNVLKDCSKPLYSLINSIWSYRKIVYLSIFLCFHLINTNILATITSETIQKIVLCSWNSSPQARTFFFIISMKFLLLWKSYDNLIWSELMVNKLIERLGTCIYFLPEDNHASTRASCITINKV